MVIYRTKYIVTDHRVIYLYDTIPDPIVLHHGLIADDQRSFQTKLLKPETKKERNIKV